jgi:homoserine dehydrogenase
LPFAANYGIITFNLNAIYYKGIVSMVGIAILGHGTVGSGTAEVFFKNKEQLCRKCGEQLELKYILDIRTFPDCGYADRFVTDFSVIENDPEVKVVTEAIGGQNIAYDFVKRALLAGKSVVTSNKELVSCKGAELMNIAADMGVNFLFEASVGGGIPIIRPLHQCFAADEITSIAGILNGTTNYILTKMQNERISFDQALKQAQELGYAERNPEADIMGQDTCRKICILASLAFGKAIYPESVTTRGIDKVMLEDLQAASRQGYAIKLLGAAKKRGDSVQITVEPMLVPTDNQLAGVSDVFNAILVSADSVGDVVFYGRGAGKLPTASAMVNDIVYAVSSKGEDAIRWNEAENQDFVTGYHGMRSANMPQYMLFE